MIAKLQVLAGLIVLAVVIVATGASAVKTWPVLFPPNPVKVALKKFMEQPHTWITPSTTITATESNDAFTEVHQTK